MTVKNKKIKIVYVISVLANHGPINILFNIIKHIDFNIFDVKLITLRPEEEESRIEEFKKFPIEIIQLNIESKIRNLPIIYSKFKSIIKLINPDIIHSHCPRSLFLNYLLPNNFEKIHTIHNYPGYVEKVLYGRYIGIITTQIILFALKRINHPIACAENIKNLLYDNHKIKVSFVRNGCDYPSQKVSGEDKLKAKIKLDLDTNKKYFITIGRISNEKNIEFICEIFNELNTNTQLIVVGDGPLLARLRKEYINIKFIGYKRNIKEYLLSSDFYISASLTEGMANAVLEAMSLGLPLILSDIPSHKEIFDSTKKELGYLFRNNDMNSLNKGIYSTISNNVQTISNNVLECYNENFTSTRMSKEYQSIYSEIKKKQKDS